MSIQAKPMAKSRNLHHIILILITFLTPMFILLTTYPNKPRDLKKFIIGMLKGGFATRVQRTQYTKSYSLENNTIKQEEEKTLLISFIPEQQDKLMSYLKKNHPYKDAATCVILNS